MKVHGTIPLASRFYTCHWHWVNFYLPGLDKWVYHITLMIWNCAQIFWDMLHRAQSLLSALDVYNSHEMREYKTHIVVKKPLDSFMYQFNHILNAKAECPVIS